jgi:hypothetical protein
MEFMKVILIVVILLYKIHVSLSTYMAFCFVKNNNTFKDVRHRAQTGSSATCWWTRSSSRPTAAFAKRMRLGQLLRSCLSPAPCSSARRVYAAGVGGVGALRSLRLGSTGQESPSPYARGWEAGNHGRRAGGGGSDGENPGFSKKPGFSSKWRDL